jgi:hypothetical protein
MRCCSIWLAAILALGLAFPHAVQAQNPAALSGQITSAEDGAMEGVLVSAKKADSTITITVVSDAQGHYSFPASKLDAGSYALAIRAIGYELDSPKTAEIAAGAPATADIKLRKTKQLASQMSNAEWLASMPGSDQQKQVLLGCVSCHSLERVVRSTHDAAEFAQLMKRMGGYANQSMPVHPQRRVAQRALEERGDQLQKSQQKQPNSSAQST